MDKDTPHPLNTETSAEERVFSELVRFYEDKLRAAREELQTRKWSQFQAMTVKREIALLEDICIRLHSVSAPKAAPARSFVSPFVITIEGEVGALHILCHGKKQDIHAGIVFSRAEFPEASLMVEMLARLIVEVRSALETQGQPGEQDESGRGGGSGQEASGAGE